MKTKSIDHIYWDASQIPSPQERDAYLNRVCAGDGDLRREVEELLAIRSKAESFLETPVVQRVFGEAADDTRTGPAPAGADARLDFLESSESPGSLGRIGHYEVQGVIGRGGMGIVLKAFDENLHRVVAVKVMAPQLATSASARQRFTREARAAAAIAHDHIVTIHGVDEANGLPYIVMQYVDGLSLQERLDETGPLNPREVLRIGMQTASGLAAAHAQGLVHRDVKPANILLENGVERVKITDFGLARASDDAGMTQAGVIAGTPQYMSPEQAEGKPVDHRSDLFSLGSVLYAMCVGHPPFRGSTARAVLKGVCEDQPGSLREIDPAVPDWLAEIVEKLQAKDPAERFESAAEVAGLLARHLACLEQPSLPPPPRLGPARRSRRRTAVLAAVALLLVATLAAAPQIIVRIKDKDGRVKEIPVPSGGSVEVVRDGNVVVAEPRDPRAPREIRRFVGHTKALWSVAFSPDGHWAVSGGWDDIIRLWDLETGKEARRFEGHTAPVIRVAFSPDSHRILSAGGDGTVRLWDVGTGKEVRRFEGPAHGVYGLAVSPDGRHALFGGWSCEIKDGSKVPVDCALRLVELETGKELRRFEGHTGRVLSVAFSPDGRRALSGANSWNKHGEPHDTVLRLWDVETGKVIRRFEGHTQGVDSVALSADGRLALSGGGDTTVRLWDVETGKELRRFEGHRAMVTGVAFSPDGRRALSGSGDKSLMLWDVETGQPLHVFEDHIDAVTSVAFSPDGRRALSGSQFRDRTMRLWQLPPPDRK